MDIELAVFVVNDHATSRKQAELFIKPAGDHNDEEIPFYAPSPTRAFD